MDKNDKERIKNVRRAEAEKKRKIRELEAEIEAMQIDHAETFGYAPPVRKKDKAIDTVLFITGTLFLAAGLLWMFVNMRISAAPAVIKLGNLRFSRSIYSLPLIAGILGFLLIEKKKIPLIITMAGFLAAFISLFAGTDLSSFPYTAPMCAVMITVSCLGFAMLAAIAVRMFLRSRKKHHEHQEPQPK